MCGINGIFNLDKKLVNKEELSRMNSAMVHRGPDDEGYYVEGNVGLAMRRLSIIDIQGGRQPIANEDEKYWIVCNGEIYNYLELREELEAKGHVFKTKSDTETIVHLYEETEERCLERLNGIFAFSIWDKRKKELFVAVDRLGVKPLYYSSSLSLFCFSSELKSLLTLNIDKRIDYDSYLLYLFLLYVPYPYSIIKNVLKLEPATYIKINGNGRLIKKSYWGIEGITPKKKVDKEKSKEELISLLSDAVRLQLRSDVPVGTFLSGGIDSSALVAMISSLGEKGALRTFSVGYEGHYADERPYALRVSKLFGTKHTELFLTPEDVRKNLERIVWYMDEPIGDSAAIPTFLLSGMARQAGIKVVLNGTGGDEVFGGYPRYLMGGGLAGFLRRKAEPLRNAARSLLKRPIELNTAVRLREGLINYVCRVNGVNLAELREFLIDGSSFKAILNGVDCVMKECFELPKGLPQTERFMRFDLRTYLVGDLLFLLDKMTMANSIEGRVPLIDHRIVEFMFALPAGLKIEGGSLKSLAKEALKGILPDDVLARQKMGFGGPVFFWLSNNILNEFEIFGQKVSPITKELVKLDRIYRGTKFKNCSLWETQFIYNLAIFELWYRSVFEGGANG